MARIRALLQLPGSDSPPQFLPASSCTRRWLPSCRASPSRRRWHHPPREEQVGNCSISLSSEGKLHPSLHPSLPATPLLEGSPAPPYLLHHLLPFGNHLHEGLDDPEPVPRRCLRQGGEAAVGEGGNQTSPRGNGHHPQSHPGDCSAYSGFWAAPRWWWRTKVPMAMARLVLPTPVWQPKSSVGGGLPGSRSSRLGLS